MCYCRFLRSAGMLDQISARKFLEAARLTGDKMIFYTVYKFFEQRNIRTRGSAKFSPGLYYASNNHLMSSRQLLEAVDLFLINK